MKKEGKRWEKRQLIHWYELCERYVSMKMKIKKSTIWWPVIAQSVRTAYCIKKEVFAL